MILKQLFERFNESRVRYCVLRKYENLPKKPEGDVDIAIEKKNYKKAINIIKKMGFLKYPFVYPHEFYFYYDSNRLIKLDLVKKERIEKIKKYKNFYVPRDWDYRVKKNFILKILTFVLRRFYWFGRGKLLCFVGPDGAGKTSVVMSVKRKLGDFPINKTYIRFSTGTYSKFKRGFDLIKNLVKIELAILSGEIILCDRYMYLTFRNHPSFKRILLKIIRRPYGTYFLENSAEKIYKRKQEIGLEEIKTQLKLFNFLAKQRKEFRKIKTNKGIDKISDEIVREVLFSFKR